MDAPAEQGGVIQRSPETQLALPSIAGSSQREQRQRSSRRQSQASGNGRDGIEGGGSDSPRLSQYYDDDSDELWVDDSVASTKKRCWSRSTMEQWHRDWHDNGFALEEAYGKCHNALCGQVFCFAGSYACLAAGAQPSTYDRGPFGIELVKYSDKLLQSSRNNGLGTYPLVLSVFHTKSHPT
ncbi:unnamed protein product [Ectocarpus sp. 13 AM-2016]